MIFNPLKEILVLDCETTGFSERDDEILSLSVVSGDKEVVFDEFFKPERKKSWDDAQAVNGISPDMVRNCKPFSEYKERLRGLFRHKIVLIYNADFDSKFLRYELSDARQVFCVMKSFAEFFREPNKNRKGYNKSPWKWKKLAEAMTVFGVEWEGDPHSAKADALGTLGVFLGLVEQGRKQYAKAYTMNNPHEKHNFVVMNTMAYLGLEHGEVIGIFNNCTETYCRQIIKADYPNPEHLLLCKTFKGGIKIPVILDNI